MTTTLQVIDGIEQGRRLGGGGGGGRTIPPIWGIFFTHFLCKVLGQRSVQKEPF